MYNRNEFLDRSAQGALEQNRRQQEERKQAMLRQQKERELKQLEGQLFYKKQEVARLKTLFSRLKREAVVKENTARKEKQDVENIERETKDTESRLQKLEQEINILTSEVADKIAKEKAVILEHERELQKLEKEKRDTELKKGREKKTFLESMSRLLFFKKREQQQADRAEDIFKRNQTQLHGTEQSLKTFNQEVTVLENKIRALRSKSL